MPIKEVNKTKLCCGGIALLDGLVNFITEEENEMFMLFLFFKPISKTSQYNFRARFGQTFSWGSNRAENRVIAQVPVHRTLESTHITY